jgi:hypothetical protein
MSLSGLPRPYNSRPNISRQLCSHCIHRIRSSGILCQHYPGCCRTPGSLPSFLGHQLTHSLTHPLTNYLTGVYDLWTDGREDTSSERRPFLGTDSKETSSIRYLGNLPCCLGSEPQRARHNMFTWLIIHYWSHLYLKGNIFPLPGGKSQAERLFCSLWCSWTPSREQSYNKVRNWLRAFQTAFSEMSVDDFTE